MAPASPLDLGSRPGRRLSRLSPLHELRGPAGRRRLQRGRAAPAAVSPGGRCSRSSSSRLPLFFHGIYGLFLTATEPPGAAGGTARHRALAVAQRVTGVVLFAFVLFHLWTARLVQIRDHGDLDLFRLMQSALASPWIRAFYVAGILSATFHLSAGLWTFSRTWGLARSPRAQRRRGRPGRGRVRAAFGAGTALAERLPALAGARSARRLPYNPGSFASTMKVHEYQAKSILAPLRRRRAARGSDDEPGRGARDRQAARRPGRRQGADPRRRPRQGRRRQARQRSRRGRTTLAKKILGMTLVTPQTGPAGRVVQKVLVEEALDIARELYLAVTLDRSRGCPVVMASLPGGMDIEEVAAKDPEGDPPRAGRSRRSACSRSRPASSPSRSGSPGDERQEGRARSSRRSMQAYVETDATPRGDQPAARHEAGRRARARRQDELRRQRAVPPPGHRGAARPRRGGPARGRGVASSA